MEAERTPEQIKEALEEAAAFSEFLGKSITIPTPLRSSMARGLNSNKKADTPKSFRIAHDEVLVLDTAAELLGMKSSELLRWLIYFGGNEILKAHQSYQKMRLRKKRGLS